MGGGIDPPVHASGALGPVIVVGNAIHAINIGEDFTAMGRNLVGGRNES